MINLSITKMFPEYVEENCADLIEQQKNCVTTHAMLTMYFFPEGTPVVNKAERQCKLYDEHREILEAAGAKHGVLVQSTLGHITPPFKPSPFQPVVNFITGEERVATCCPLDPGFQDYIRGQFKILAKHKPGIVMIDDDVGLIYRDTKGCACKYHLAEFARRAGKKMTREEIYAHTQGNTEEDKYYTQIYVDIQRDGLLAAVRAMREGLDMVDPTIPGFVSGIYPSSFNFVEFTGELAAAFAGKGNPPTARLNGGPYSVSSSARGFTLQLCRAAMLRENVKDKVEVFLAETDTCPHNRYSTSASLMHAHFVGSILEGATGAKHWISSWDFDLSQGKAYRKILAKHAKFYDALCDYVKDLKPFGCRIPLTLEQNYGFVATSKGRNFAPWTTCVLERFGLPLYFANQGEGAVFLDDFSVDGFDDETIRNFMSSTLFLSVGAVEKLEARGFAEDIGVTVRRWDGEVLNGEIVDGYDVRLQYGNMELVPCRDDVEVLSESYHYNAATDENIPMFPGVTRCKNRFGGNTIAFCGTPDMPFLYYTAFSLLCGVRKRQFVKILSQDGLLPLYYPEDAEVYLRAGYLPNGERMVVLFNLGFDVLEDIPLTLSEPVSSVEWLQPDGTRAPLDFEQQGDTIRIAKEAITLMPLVLFLN